MTKANMMREAHKLAKTFEGDYTACLALALRTLNRIEEVKVINIDEREPNWVMTVLDEISDDKNKNAKSLMMDFKKTNEKEGGKVVVSGYRRNGRKSEYVNFMIIELDEDGVRESKSFISEELKEAFGNVAFTSETLEIRIEKEEVENHNAIADRFNLLAD